MNYKIDEQGNPILDQFSEDGFVDCVFIIRDLQEFDNSYSFHLSASYSGQALGMNVDVVKNIQGGYNSDMEMVKEHVYEDGVIFRRSGDESDRLITTIANLYGLEVDQLKMVEREKFTGIALHQGELEMEVEPIKVKLFGNDSEESNPDDYYESFFNLDLKNGFVFWNEKDQEYRDPLVRSLSK